MTRTRRAWRSQDEEEEVMMDDPKKVQEFLGQVGSKAVETMTVWADAHQRVVHELVELGASSAKEGVKLYAELQQAAIEALRDSQAAALRWQTAWQDGAKDPVQLYQKALAERGHFLAKTLGVGLPAVALGLGAGTEAGPGHHGSPPRATHPLLEDALHLALVGDDALEARLHRALQEVLPGLAVLDELVKEADRQTAAMATLVLEDNLGQGHAGEVLTRRRVDHGHLLTRADHLLDLLEGDVPTLLSVVEFPVRVPLDDVRHGTPLQGDGIPWRHDESHNTPRQGPDVAPC